MVYTVSMWTEHNNTLTKEFTFADFKTALTFVNKIGELAEAVQHHPDIELGWGRVAVTLTTHSEHAVTTKDRELAAQIDDII